MLTHEVVMSMHTTSVEGVDDMATLGDLHEAAILYNIQQRYCKDTIYVSPEGLSVSMYTNLQVGFCKFHQLVLYIHMRCTV